MRHWWVMKRWGWWIRVILFAGRHADTCQQAVMWAQRAKYSATLAGATKEVKALNSAFDQAIDGDRISVIDYLDANSEFYVIGDEIEKIFKKLNKGIAIIGLQKQEVNDDLET